MTSERHFPIDDQYDLRPALKILDGITRFDDVAIGAVLDETTHEDMIRSLCVMAMHYGVVAFGSLDELNRRAGMLLLDIELDDHPPTPEEGT